MDPTRIAGLVSRMTPPELRDALWFVDACERTGTMTAEDADEWRRRILARRAFLGLESVSTATS